MYQALYRKWRPSVFDDVVGQEHITSILKSEVENGKISHAYLFCGPRGTGKTTCAKIIAKAANCEHPENGNPCGKCDACRSVDMGTATDIIEMDAASNNGVDNIRELRDGVIYSPAELKYRVYIIDEVHMLSVSAFNALLKTLEEPPKHVIFILATTELHKIPATVLSRCQRFDFHRVAEDAIVGRLKQVCKGEGIKAEEDALSLIAGLSQGGMRDSLNMLEYCAGSGDTITAQRAEELLGAASRTLLASLAGAIAKKDTTAALGIMDTIYLSSRDIAVFWRETIAFCRDLLVAIGTKMANVRDENIRLAASAFSLPRLLHVLNIMIDAEADMQRNPAFTKLYAEMALIRACDTSLDSDNAALLARISAVEDKIAGGLVAHAFPTAQASATPAVSVTEPPILPTEAPIAPPASPAKNEPSTEVKPAEAKVQSGAERTFRGFRKWQEAIRKLSATEGLIVPFLQAASAYEGSDGNFYIFFDNKFGESLLTEDRRLAVLNAINVVGERRYQPYQLIVSTREVKSEIREPIEDLAEQCSDDSNGENI